MEDHFKTNLASGGDLQTLTTVSSKFKGRCDLVRVYFRNYFVSNLCFTYHRAGRRRRNFFNRHL